MALSRQYIKTHVDYWTDALTSQHRPYRKNWPSCLFHHAPLEGALAIMIDGNIRSRNDPQRQRTRDVAASGVIENLRTAHDRVRLYFRPRTPTQFHIEGIRKASDCKYGPDAHAPILVMFVLDSARVLALPDVLFSDRNMQKLGSNSGDSEEFFSTIPFDKVFHEGGIAGDYSIIEHRCAEVLPTSPLPLGECLKGIWFRSEAERDTLLHLLGESRPRWERLCRVSEELKLFDKKYSFLNEIGLSTEGVSFRINHRPDLQPINLEIQVHDLNGRVHIDFHDIAFATFNETGGRWICRKPLDLGSYHVRVKIEGHIAYDGVITVEDSLL